MQKQPKTATPVSQSELKRYTELRARVEALEKEAAAVRRGLIDRLEAGATVEHGPLAAQVHQVEQRQLNARSLVTVLGGLAVEELEALVEPAFRRHSRAIFD